MPSLFIAPGLHICQLDGLNQAIVAHLSQRDANIRPHFIKPPYHADNQAQEGFTVEAYQQKIQQAVHAHAGAEPPLVIANSIGGWAAFLAAPTFPTGSTLLLLNPAFNVVQQLGQVLAQTRQQSLAQFLADACQTPAVLNYHSGPRLTPCSLVREGCRDDIIPSLQYVADQLKAQNNCAVTTLLPTHDLFTDFQLAESLTTRAGGVVIEDIQRCLAHDYAPTPFGQYHLALTLIDQALAVKHPMRQTPNN